MVKGTQNKVVNGTQNILVKGSRLRSCVPPKGAVFYSLGWAYGFGFGFGQVGFPGRMPG